MSVIIPPESARSIAESRPASDRFQSSQRKAWRMVGWLGVIYLIMSVIDLALGWYPLGFGKPEWEFGTISATIAGFAIPTLSLYLMFGSALARERTHVVRRIAVAMIVLAVFLAILCVVYLTSVPLALMAGSANPSIDLGMKKAIIKSLTLFLGYETLFIVGAIMGLRRRPGASERLAHSHRTK